MPYLKINIISFYDESQPGFVRCGFTDAHGKEWFIIDKVPIVSEVYLDENSKYPVGGTIPCEIINQPTMSNSKLVLTIDISTPIAISTEDDKNIFDVFEEQLTP